MSLLYSQGATGWSMDDIRGYQRQSDASVSFIRVSVQPWLSSNTMKWKDSLLEHHQANSSDAEVLCMFRLERDGSVSKFWAQTLLKGLNVVSESMRRYIYCPPPSWGRGDWPVRAEMLLPSMHLSEIWLSLGESSRLQDLQPVDMLVMSSSVSGRSYRSVVTISGQGRLNDILTWNKAKGCMNSKYKKYSNTKKSLLQWTSTSWCTDLKH